MESFLESAYLGRWESDTLLRVMAIRTSFVSGMQDFLIRSGLLNLERVQISLLTDPLAHEVEHVPTVDYKGHSYVTTHSMIYSKLLACIHPGVPGVFVDSPNLRLELPTTDGSQRGRYLVDFSQLDVELRRNRGVEVEDYFEAPDRVRELLREDMDRALGFFEKMFRAGMERILELNRSELEALGVAIEPPQGPFPVFDLDEGLDRHPREEVEVGLGEETDSPFFFITGIMRENYDLVYPFLRKDGSRRTLKEVPSRDVYNYDLCVKSTLRSPQGRTPGRTTLAGTTPRRTTPAKEVLSGGIREWLPEPIVARLLENGILHAAPRFLDGTIENIDELGGYGPFLMVAHRRDGEGRLSFPETFGGGIGIERALWALLRGPEIRQIEDVTCFGKNPDSHECYLF